MLLAWMWFWIMGLLPVVAGLPRTIRPAASSSSDSHHGLPAPALNSSWMVVISPNSPPQEQWAAGQLADSLGQWLNLGAGLAIGAPADAASHPAVFVGAAAATDTGVVSLSTLRTLGSDAFWCHSKSRGTTGDTVMPRLYLTGGVNRRDEPEPRGTINAVFEYLRKCGFRWWTPNVTALPNTTSAPTLAVCDGVTRPSLGGSRKIQAPNLHTLSMPNYLGANGTTRAQKMWWVANHMNGGGDHTGNSPFPLLPDKMGGEIMESNDTTTSTVYTFVPPVTFTHWGSYYDGQFAVHPEWYSLIHQPQHKDNDSPCLEHDRCIRTHNLSGTGACGPAPGVDNTAYPFAQLCMTNHAMRQYMIQHTKQKLRWDRANNQHHDIVNIAGNDQCADSECHCDICSAARKADAGNSNVSYAGQSGLNLQVANDLAAAIADEFEETRVMLQIYKGTLTPPSSTTPHPRVLLQFTTEGYAPATRNAIQPLTHASNSLTFDQLTGWRDIAVTDDQIHIWEYIGNFCHSLILQADWYRAFSDAKLFGALGFGGIISEGQALAGADLHELRSWVLSSLYWDATRDIDDLVSEFLVGFYSADAAPHILRHMRAYTDFVERTNAFASGCGCDIGQNECVTVEVLFASFTALDVAMRNEVVHNRTVVAARVEILRLSPHYVILHRWSEACMFARKNDISWPFNDTLSGAISDWVSSVIRLLGDAGLATEKGWLVANANSTQVCMAV